MLSGTPLIKKTYPQIQWVNKIDLFQME